MADIDFYKALGVAREASADEIRTAYKKLVRENHPDAKPGDSAAAERFKQVNEAYDVLKDPEKREQYDRFGTTFKGGGPGGGGGQAWSGGPADFEQMFGGGGGGFGFEQLFRGAGGPGGGFGGGRAARPRKGGDQRVEIDVDFQTAAVGGTREIQVRRNGRVERLDVKIPAGVRDEGTIRLAGQGDPGTHGGPNGDLLLKIRVARHPWFRREGFNLLVDVPVTPSEAALGAKVEVPTLTEGEVVMTIPPGTSSGQKLRLRGKGIRDPKTNTNGDQFAVVKIVVPKDVDDETRALYEQLGERGFDPRAGAWS